MASTFFFRAVASDGKIRTGSLTGDDEKLIARELRKQGLTPIYVGVAPRKAALEFKLPSFGKGRRDVLFFTQELSTLLNATVPLDRALSITAELTEHASFRFIVLDILRVLKGGRSLADSLGTHPEYFSDLYVNMVRAGEASGALAVIFERLSEFERSRDDLRNYIISSMIYPALLAGVGLASIVLLLTFVVPRFASIFSDSTMKIPLPTKMLLEVSNVVTAWWWVGAGALAAALDHLAGLHPHRKRASLVGRSAPEAAAAGRRAIEGRDGPLRARHGNPGGQLRAAGAIARHRGGHAEQ